MAIPEKRGFEPASVAVPEADADRFQTLELSGTVLLVDDKTGMSYSIGFHGRRVFVLLRSGASVEEAASLLALETGSDKAVVLQDTRRLVADLVEIGVFVPVRT